MFHVPEEDRFVGPNHPLSSSSKYGNNGVFIIGNRFNIIGKKFQCIASDGSGWDHVSVTLSEPRCPTWEEMCQIKDIFWDCEDVVVQYHPAKKDYINNHPYCLHLWRKQNHVIETPPTYMIGI